jgi:hypothetical protein
VHKKTANPKGKGILSVIAYSHSEAPPYPSQVDLIIIIPGSINLSITTTDFKYTIEIDKRKGGLL